MSRITIAILVALLIATDRRPPAGWFPDCALDRRRRTDARRAVERAIRVL